MGGQEVVALLERSELFQRKRIDPAKFGEVITNDVRVAKAARELEQQAPPLKRKGLRRVQTLARRPTA